MEFPHVIGKKISLGNSNFASMIEKNALYADKSLLIKDIIEDASPSILIVRPRRWGKTLNMSMLHHFFAAEAYNQKTAGLFDNLLIANADGGQYMQYQGKYPVIYLSFKDVKDSYLAETVANLSNLINEMYREHAYLKSAIVEDDDRLTYSKYAGSRLDKKDIEQSLKFLSRVLEQHYKKKAYILIDEYDTPLNSAYGASYFDELVILLKNFLSNGLKDNSYLEKGIMTGILCISKDSMLSGLNNLKVYTVLTAKYSQYFGFTERELDLLFENQGLAKDEAAVKAWYNGYLIGGLTIYNPWSILSYLSEEGMLAAYWVNTASEDLIKAAMQNSSPTIKEQLQNLILGRSITAVVTDSVRFDELLSNTEAIWGVLLYMGYLTTLSWQIGDDGSDYECQLIIPNKEVRGLYKTSFIEWLGGSSAKQQRMLINDILHHLVASNIEKFAEEITSLLQSVASIRDYANQPEAFYHGFMLALTAALLDDYYIASNKESGKGYPDLMFIPKEKTLLQCGNDNIRAVILEFKHVAQGADAKTVAAKALEQIDVKHYASSIKQHSYVKEIIKVGIAFDGKNVEYADAVNML